MFPLAKVSSFTVTGIVRGRKVSRIAFFAIVREKTFAIQAISYIKIPVEIKSARKHSRMLPDLRNSRNFSSADDSRYTVLSICMHACAGAGYKLAVLHGDHSWQRGTNFGCRNQSRGGDRFWQPKLVRGTSFFCQNRSPRTDFGRGRFWRDRPVIGVLVIMINGSRALALNRPALAAKPLLWPWRGH